jgi:hypothetical protein
MFPNMLIETTATEKSLTPSQYWGSELTWSWKKKDGAGGNERFFIGQWNARDVLSRQMQKHDFCTPYCNFMLASSE